MANAMPTYKDYISDELGRAQLASLVLEDRHTDDEQFVPPRVKPSVALDFLNEAVKPDLKIERTQRAADVARFYVLRTLVGKFMELARRREPNLTDYCRSVEVLRLAGDLGNEDEVKRAAEYYDYLVNHRLFEKAVPLMIECYFHVDSVNENVIADALKKKLQSIHPGRGEPQNPSDEYIEFEGYANNALPVTTIARKLKQKILGEKDPLTRATMMARTYIGLDDPGGVDWPRWASYAIMAEVQRSSDQTVVEGLRAAMKGLDPKKESEQYLALARSRASRSIAFLGGRLSPEEEEWQAFGKVRRFQLEG